jgi:hypothetical protein
VVLKETALPVNLIEIKKPAPGAGFDTFARLAMQDG